MRAKVVVTRRLPEEAAALLGASTDVCANPEDEPMAQEALAAAVADADGLICMLSDRVDRALIEAAPRLKVISTVAVGYDNIDLAAAGERGIAVANTPDVLTETTADLSWALLLGAARRVVEADASVRRGEFHCWKLLGHLGRDVYGKTLGVVGFGRIGRAVARRAAGFDMRVLYHGRRRAPADVEKAVGATYADLDELLAESHYVSLHCPLTPETKHLIDAAALARMRPDAFLVNVARGPVVDEAALVAALREGRIAGAALDVYEREPALAEGLAELRNVVLLPHIGSASVETRGRMSVMAVESCLDALAGRRPRFLVAVSR